MAKPYGKPRCKPCHMRRGRIRRLADVFTLESAPEGTVRRLWGAYLREHRPGRRVLRIASFYTLYLVILICLLPLLHLCGGGGFPTRGSTSLFFALVAMFVSGSALGILLFLVTDITRLCAWFIRQLLDDNMERAWPRRILVARCRGRGLMPHDVNEWLSIRLIARHTKAVSRLIYYPFVLVFIMLVSRNEVFDGWGMPYSAIAVFSFILFVAIYSAMLLRVAAKRARDAALDRLRERRARIGDPDSARAKSLKGLIDEITAERAGAFSRFGDNPVVGALLIPSGGMGALALLDYLAKVF